MAKPEALPPIDITKLHPTDRGLMEYAGQFGFNPFMDLADFLEGKTVLDSGSGYDMLAIELALIDSTTRVVSVDPKRPVDLKNRLSEAKKRQVKLAEYLSAERDDKQLVALIKQVDANGLTGLAHEVDLPSNSFDVVFDLNGPMLNITDLHLDPVDERWYLEATWDKYFKLLKPGGVILVIAHHLSDAAFMPSSVYHYKLDDFKAKGISWQKQGQGLKIFKPEV